ncbi:maltokinase N-terminal cap-like domain-containing protein [Microlunatus soli]|uniref:Maltokinase N-terminal cap domain-containing protein n=1 Tax=Microlunatus soli TaxID=630515 RepID=A0A1H2AJ94_9ACTN|nr:hypothetical protein [Microlunatus soli]SDT46085.1 hypothetical protein SAMN04489812_5988 [Microlunatus soli]
MAIIYNATITPSKPEVVDAWLDRQSWAGAGPSEMLGSYRFDDPEGEVGVEAMVLRRGDRVLQAVLTYRPGPLDGADDQLIATVEHSVLGRRWVYDAAGDPVAAGCFSRALAGDQEQAVMEIWEGDRIVDRREPTVRISRVTGNGSAAEADRSDGVVEVADPDGRPVLIARVASAQIGGSERLIARWADGEAVVAARP